ncbi:alpha/beta fold hydrolase [Microbacterium sp. zg.Y1084]|uniref:alpha/beta fold hydrolase n=1 Tax=Microbacterium sp. zg.Y1084 TaxID=2969667 RepID=UPI00214C74F5|nr:alpha/beta hydrolase [Microbacterium sp. zg.Y1084]MCR2812293.1 alpha/beta hydrolase [Microbacterium sp. zg.Y1084]
MGLGSGSGRAQGVMGRAAAADAALTPIDWSRFPPGAERDRVLAPSGSLARVSMGPSGGQRVVLVPGVTGSKEDFVRMMPLLAAAGYRAESYDMAGQYESCAAGPENLEPPQRHYTLDLFVDDLVAVLRSAATPAHVLGYSFAGTVASIAAARYPELFASLTLLSSPPVAGQALRSFRILGPITGLVPASVEARLMMWAVRNNVHRAPRDRAVFVRARFALTRRASVEDIFGLMKHTPAVADALRATGLPVLVVAGSGDVWPVEAHDEFARRLGATLLVIHTGHSPCESAPNQVTEAMLAMISA